MDLARGKADAKRSAHAGGPRKMARSPGRAAGADRFPSKKIGRKRR
jgi:hypothetical protein